MAKKGWVYDFSHNSQDFFSLFKLEGIFVKSFTYSSGKAFPLHITYSSSAHDNSIISALRK